MRKPLLTLIFGIFALFPLTSYGQLNKAYFFWMGRTYLIEDKYEAAIETLNVLLKTDPNAHEAYFLRGVAKYNLDDLLGAEQDFTTAITKNPVYTLAYHYRAITRTRLGNYDDALGDFQEAIDLRPDLPGPYFSRGVTYLLNQQHENAVRDFDQFIRQENKVAEAYVNRGLAYLYLGDTTRAYTEFNTAIRTNREDPNGYSRRGALYLTQKKYEEALADFDKAIECDSTYTLAYFNRALAFADQHRPVEALSDMDRVIQLDSTNSLAYFNRAIIRTQIGDYNRALDDYNTVAMFNPGNVLVFYNRALLNSQLGNLNDALDDYSRAIELYPDFANAYIGRSNLRYLLRDERGGRVDREIAESKIAEYRSKLTDSTFSVFADTSRTFNQLLSFDNSLSRRGFDNSGARDQQVTMLPLFRFSLAEQGEPGTIDPQRYYVDKLEIFRREIDNPYLVLTTAETNLPADSLMAMDRRLEAEINERNEWLLLFERGITQSLIKQYTNAVNLYTAAIEKNPSNPFLYMNRSTTRSEMTDFISSIENSYQRIMVESDPVNRLKNNSSRTYNYEEAIADLNKAAKLLPEFAHIYYNRANLHAQSGRLPEALEDYSKAIELYPGFAEAHFNRGLVQIYLKDTRKGLLDISKAGELGISEAYSLLRRYSDFEQQ